MLEITASCKNEFQTFDQRYVFILPSYPYTCYAILDALLTFETLMFDILGDKCPKLIPGSLRIYSMRFCPYAQRAILVANAKGIK